MLGLIAGALVLAGVAVRLRVFLYNRSLWLDEAMLGLNYVRKTYAELLRTGDYIRDQVAPVAFSLLERATVDVVGPTDWALRLLPLAAGIVALPLLYLTARRLADRTVATLAVGLLAFSVPAIYYATEVKPYSVDMVAAVAVFYLADRARAGGLDVRKALALGVAGGLLCFVSQPVVFVLAACGVGLAADQLRGDPAADGTALHVPDGHGAVRGDRVHDDPAPRIPRRDRLIALGTLAAVWAALFGLNWAFFLRPQMSISWLYEHHSQAFMPIVPGSVGEAMATGGQTAEVVGGVTGLVADELAAFLFLVGLVTLVARQNHMALAFALPWLIGYLASTAELYPFIRRLLQFALPGILFTVAVGLRALVADRRWWPVLAVVGFVLVGWSNLEGSARLLLDPRSHPLVNRDQTRRGLEYIREHARPGDRVWVYHGAGAGVRFYRDRYLPPEVEVVYGESSREDRSGYVRQLEPLMGKDRLWLLFNPFPYDTRGRDRRYILERLEAVGATRLDGYVYPVVSRGAVWVYLYTFEGSGSNAGSNGSGGVQLDPGLESGADDADLIGLASELLGGVAEHVHGEGRADGGEDREGAIEPRDLPERVGHDQEIQVAVPERLPVHAGAEGDDPRRLESLDDDREVFGNELVQPRVRSRSRSRTSSAAATFASAVGRSYTS